MGGVISYNASVKINELGVDKRLIDEFSVVSCQVAEAMAQGIQQKYQTTYAIATTGIAGPSGGTPDKPVGTVWIGIATPDGVFANHYEFGDNRERNIRKTALQVLNLLRKEILSSR